MADNEIIPNASGRPNEKFMQRKTFTNHSYGKNGKVTIGSTYNFIAVEKIFEHQSISSPWVNGKLKLRSNPYFMNKRETSRGIIKVSGSNPSYGGFVSYHYFSTSGGNLPIDITGRETRAVSRARTAFHKEVANASANILLALVERKEIIETVLTLTKKAFMKIQEYKKLLDRYNRLTNPAARKRMLERYLSGFNGKGLSKSKDKIADLWLFYSYAIMPIILEIKTIVDHIKKIEPRAVHGRGRMSFGATVPIYDNYYSGERVFTGFVSSHVRGYVTVVDPYKKLLAEWGFTNLATVIWERITYSFVIDWFINIGSWLSTLTSLDGVIVTEYSETTTVKSGYSISNFKSINAGGWLIQSTIENPDFSMFKQKRRSAPSDPPKPEIFTDVNLNWRRIISGLSLLNQQFGKLR